MNDLTAEAITKIQELATSVQPTVKLEPNAIYAIQDSVGNFTVTNTRDYVDMLDRPPGPVTRKATVWDAESFLRYLARFDEGPDALEIWAHRDNRTITAVLDAPMAGEPSWQGHTLTLAVRHTPEWKAWADINGKLQDQTAMAEFIEDRLPDFIEPTGAEMLEIATTLQAKTKVDFESAVRLDSGQVAIGYREEIDAKAGAKGKLSIPATVSLILTPFQGEAGYRVTARFRYRIRDGHLALAFKVDQFDRVLDDAFAAVVEKVATVVPVPVFNGTR